MSLDIGIVTRSIDEMRQFYGDVVGLEAAGSVRIPDGVLAPGTLHRMVTNSSSVVKLIDFDDTPTNRSPGGSAESATGFRYLTLRVEDLDSVLAAAAAMGLSTQVEKTELRPGLWMAIVLDPDGNCVELVEASA